METIKISRTDLRRFLIIYQGLGSDHRYEGKGGIKSYFEKVGCVQFDPLNVVGRNADLTLQSRIDGYTASMLHELLYEDRLLVDGWDKQMSIYNVEDWPKLKKVREAMTESTINTLKNRKSYEALEHVDLVKEKLREIGATKPGAIEVGAVIRGTWGHGKVSSVVMDYLFQSGELGIKTKVGTQKVYDFIENLIDEQFLADTALFDSEEAFCDWYVKRRIGSIGLYWDRNGDGWLGKYVSKKGLRLPAIGRLEAGGEIHPVEVDGFKEIFYIRNEDLALLDAIISSNASSESRVKEARFLAPLDNLMWDRKLIKQVFDFEYSWEVYKPASKREYGYYVLPVIYGEEFIGRFEPEHVKGGNVLNIKNWWWEDGLEITPEMIAAVKRAFDRFKVYLGVSLIQNDIDDLISKN